MTKLTKFTGLAAGVLLLVPALAFAQTNWQGNKQFSPPAATGTVASISGSTITLTGSNSTIYTIDASSATVSKFSMSATAGTRPTPTTIAVTDIAVGDTLRVFGTASGSNITATKIMDGVMPQGGLGGKRMHEQSGINNSGLTTQNGQTSQSAPAARVRPTSTAGTVSSVSGTTIGMTDKNGTIYTVDASGNLKLARRPGTAMILSDIQVGDSITVMGVVSGANITASSIRDASLETRNIGYAGAVTVINGASFTLTTKAHGTVTVNTDSNTVFNKNGKADSIRSLVVGLNVTVSGSLDTATNILSATKVNMVIRTLAIHFTGTVQSISANTLSINSGAQVYAVDATNAKFLTKSGQVGTVSNIQPNDSVTVYGTHLTASNNITATRVRDLTQ